MERKIGEIFEYKGEWYQCVKGNTCDECSFSKSSWNCLFDGTPYCSDRSDEIEVIFKKLEKVGEPFTCNYYGDDRLLMMQEYRAYDNRIVPINGIAMYVTDEKHKRVAIEIKQTKEKEDMEEKKLNLKPFDIQKAREGKPVCTRDGRKARIICFDIKGDVCPIVAAIEENGVEHLCHYDEKGLNCYKKSNEDLMMPPEKKEGWINVKKDASLFKSKEEAERNCTENYTPVRVEFEI